MKYTFLILFLTFLIFGCKPDNAPAFRQVSASASGITFNNRITETDSVNYFTFPYLYLGAGVATGDFDNDGLTDIFFSGNMTGNQLYRNLGDFKFANITETAGVAAPEKWCMGTTLVDIDNDGYLDIYVSAAGEDGDKSNLLFVNNRDLTFTESAKQYGLADAGSSVQSVFFDYDKDGDLDCLVANYPKAPFGAGIFFYKSKMRNPDLGESDRLYRNEGNGTFTDVSAASGIANYGLSLGISVADFNDDGYEDVYISNDFATPDRFFFNNGDGTFTDKIKETTFQTSLFGMGCDAADINNDGLQDLLQVDMTPRNNRRSKENMASMNPQAFWDVVNAGFHYQYMYNALQLNRGNLGADNNTPIFSNVAQLGNMATTDWSWAPFFADFDNDGRQDIYITNGIKREVNNRDFHNAMKMKINLTRSIDFISHEDIPSEPVPNFAFRNTSANTGLGFENIGEKWGIDLTGFSHGCAAADFDNDGDLDLIVNNTDQIAALYENRLPAKNYLRVRLAGDKNNRFGIGAQVDVMTDETTQSRHFSLTHGYQSAVEPVLHFGLNESEIVNRIEILWQDGTLQTLENVAVNQLLTVKKTGTKVGEKQREDRSLFVTLDSLLPENARHRENDFDDYSIEPLLPYATSKLGGHLAVVDANGDGLDDFFAGNAYGTTAALYLQKTDGGFSRITAPFAADKDFEDLGALFFDADSDGDADLYVVSGGNEFMRRPESLQDRLYLNDGGIFTKATEALPPITGSGGRVTAADFDADGDLDLFIGGRLKPGHYTQPGTSYLLQNESGKFTDVTDDLAPRLRNLGMITDAQFLDIDRDNDLDLVVVGEWMPLTFFVNEGEKFAEPTTLPDSEGWWYSLAQGDFDGDGDIDLVAGNLGQNYKYKATPDAPFEVFASDFDRNGRPDVVLSYYQDGEQYPVRGRQCSAEQIPAIALKFKDYHSFAEANLADIYGKKGLANAERLTAKTFASMHLENRGAAGWQMRPLPMLAQLSAVNDILVGDVDKDGRQDLVLAGNLYNAEIETPRGDAGIGLYLRGDGKGNFTAIDAHESGLFLPGDIKDLSFIQLHNGQKAILAGVNDGAMQAVGVRNR